MPGALKKMAAGRIAKGVGEGGQRRGDTVLLKPRACTVPVAEQVLAGQDQLERRICQGARSGRGARGVLGTGGDRPTEERKDGDGDAPPGDHHERFPDLERLRPLAFCATCSGNHRVSIITFTSSTLVASFFANLTSCAN